MKIVPDRRAGFTLVELLVVVAIMLVLATLVVAFAPSAVEGEKVARGGSQIQGWFLIAKQLALRDQSPRGVRLIPEADGLVIKSLQYIEQPDDFYPGGEVQVAGNTATLNTAMAQTHFQAGELQAGDFLEMGNGGQNANQVFRITAAPTTPNQLSIYNPAGITVPATSDYRIIRGPRPRMGEPPLELPATVVIDVGNNRRDSNDILFMPSGEVRGQGGLGMVHLWVRDAQAGSETQPVIISIYVRTGLIASHPVDLSNATNPYNLAQDGRASGM